MRVLALVVFLAYGVTAQAQQPAANNLTFEVATIKPSAPGQNGRALGWEHRRFTAHFTTITQMMQFAYDVHQKQIVNEPEWFDTETFDIDGQAEASEPTTAEWKLMLQHLLAERFNLSYHHETREMPAYVLSVAKGGPKLDPPKSLPGWVSAVRIMRGPHRFMKVMGIEGTMPELAAELQRVEMDRPVVDKTTLTGHYNFTLTATSIKPFFQGEEPATGDDAPPELFTALREQLGLQLAPAKTSVDCLILDRVSKPVLD